MQSVFIENCQNILKKLTTRNVYTLHHDFVRARIPGRLSRSDIAKMENWTDDELYSVAICQAISTIRPVDWPIILLPNDIYTIRVCINMCKDYLIEQFNCDDING